MFYPHKVQIQKIDHAQASDWQDYSAAPVAARVTDGGDRGDGWRSYQVELPWSRSIAEMYALQSLGHGFRLLWTDFAGLAVEMEVTNVTLPSERLHRNPVLLQCMQVVKNS